MSDTLNNFEKLPKVAKLKEALATEGDPVMQKLRGEILGIAQQFYCKGYADALADHDIDHDPDEG